ncbi:glycosyltransferase [Arthrobacter sp. BE255]|uniref:glycosyltransferase n=1 Tax=Arthrobacter sp. BE255 TaxID=2817721 RepID=UPI00285BF2F6|nr:glycosyltransferase [Arthrobacter sp. BE255]MDR7160862.1 glycosyltransferase involved in cell wall biosynthesis [Arthrobacter sp. BE255]
MTPIGQAHRAPQRTGPLPATPAADSRCHPVEILPGVPVLEVAVPVHNAEQSLEAALRRLHRHLGSAFPHSFRITVADNASTDGTLRIAERIARDLRDVTVVRLGEAGRGNALRTVWLASPSPVLAYLDLDLEPSALDPLLAPLLTGQADVATGARRGNPASGPLRRGFLPRCLSLVLRSVSGARFSDPQCGAKAIRSEAARRLLPHTANRSWFFDTELLVLANTCGLRVLEVPVEWTDASDSNVDYSRTALAYLRDAGRLRRDLRSGRIPVPAVRASLACGSGPYLGHEIHHHHPGQRQQGRH